MSKTAIGVYAGISAGIPLSWKVGVLLVLGILCFVLLAFGFHPLVIIAGLVTLFLAAYGLTYLISKFALSEIEAVEEISLCAGDICSSCKKGKLVPQFGGEQYTDSFLECSFCWKRY